MIEKIGLTGRAGSGKTTVAKLLEEKHDYKRYSLADGVREIAEELGHDVSKPYDSCVRDVLIAIGHTGRKINKDYWVRKLLQRISKLSMSLNNIVIDDIRFYNESVKLMGEGFIIFKLDVPENVLKERMGDGYVPRDNNAEKHIKKLPCHKTIDGTQKPEEIVEEILAYE